MSSGGAVGDHLCIGGFGSSKRACSRQQVLQGSGLPSMIYAALSCLKLPGPVLLAFSRRKQILFFNSPFLKSSLYADMRNHLFCTFDQLYHSCCSTHTALHTHALFSSLCSQTISRKHNSQLQKHLYCNHFARGCRSKQNTHQSARTSEMFCWAAEELDCRAQQHLRQH